MERTKVLVVEGQEALRHAYTNILTSEPSIGLIGIEDGGCLPAENIDGIRESLAKSKPHVLLLGAEAIDERALNMLETVCGQFPEIGIVLMAERYEPSCISRLKALARSQTRGAYLLKSSVRRVSDLIRIIHDVMHGQILIDHHVFAGLMQDSDTTLPHLNEMTPVELDILTWLAMGYKNCAIASMLCLEPPAVERLVANIFSKLASRDVERMHPGVAVALSHLADRGMIHPVPTPQAA